MMLCDINLVDNAQQNMIEYKVQPTSTGVCITCTFLDSSTTDCVAVVHQRISQLSSSGLMNIESSHKFNRSGDTVSGCIERVNLEEYQVGVIAFGIHIGAQTPPPGMMMWLMISTFFIYSHHYYIFRYFYTSLHVVHRSWSRYVNQYYVFKLCTCP